MIGKGARGRAGSQKVNGKGRGKPVRFAVIGQGYFAQSAILPAFAAAKRCELTALFSDDDTKLRVLARKYGVEHALPYAELDGFLRRGAVDAVYIALPNDMHAEYTTRAARAGVHVLCEKPIAASSAEAERMIDSCARASVKLMVAYRLHFEEANLSAVELLRSRRLGDPRYFSSTFSQQVMPGNTRTRRERASGPLRDIGIYCINAARYLFQDEPTEVIALAASKPGDARFVEIDEQVSAVLRFPGERLAQLTCGFGAHDESSYTVLGTKGALRLRPAYDVASDMVMELELDGKTRRKTFGKRGQVAPELDELAACIREGRDPEPSGEEGLADMRVIEAIEASVKSGGRVRVNPGHPQRRPALTQQRRAPAHEQPPLINVQRPSQH